MGEAFSPADQEIHVIALVGSVGGFTAISIVLEGLPETVDAAVIVLIHQEPDRASHAVDLLRTRSRMPVVAAEDGMRLQPGTVFVAPPGKHVLVTQGPGIALIASGPSPPNRPSADLLLTTLAIACGPLATAVVLSGRGHDAATGATAIHRFGGTVLASNEASSTNFDMPRATIERGHTIDHVVELDAIAGFLASRVATA